MTMLLRRRAIASSCFQLLYDTLIHQSSPASSFGLSLPAKSQIRSGNRDLWTCSRITALDRGLIVIPQSLKSSKPRTRFLRPECGQWIRSAHNGQEDEVKEVREEKKAVADGKLVLYRAKWIRPIRLLVRLKVLQLGGVMALAIPLAEYSQQGSLSLGTTLAVGAVVGGAGAASAALWYYSRRLIGEMSLLLPDLRIVKISVLDFWGNREDLLYEISDIVPPLKGLTNEELERAANKIVIPLDVIGDRQFFLSLRHGYLVHKDILFTILNGTTETRNACKHGV
ncbi:unnamed protein product [Calypogeia fissa]